MPRTSTPRPEVRSVFMGICSYLPFSGSTQQLLSWDSDAACELKWQIRSREKQQEKVQGKPLFQRERCHSVWRRRGCEGKGSPPAGEAGPAGRLRPGLAQPWAGSTDRRFAPGPPDQRPAALALPLHPGTEPARAGGAGRCSWFSPYPLKSGFKTTAGAGRGPGCLYLLPAARRTPAAGLRAARPAAPLPARPGPAPGAAPAPGGGGDGLGAARCGSCVGQTAPVRGAAPAAVITRGDYY